MEMFKLKSKNVEGVNKAVLLSEGGQMAWQSSSTSLLFKRPHIKDSYFSSSGLALWKTASPRKQLQARDNI